MFRLYLSKCAAHQTRDFGGFPISCSSSTPSPSGKYVMAKQLLSTQASTGAEKQATAKAPCFKRPHDAFLDLRGHCLEKKCIKHVLSKTTFWGLTCLLYKQNQVFCLPAFFGFSDKVPLNQYWNFIIFRLGWLTAT